MEQKTSISTILLSFINITILLFLTGCFTPDKYQNKKHIDTIKKDLDSAHKDVDKVLGLDEPSPLIDEN